MLLQLKLSLSLLLLMLFASPAIYAADNILPPPPLPEEPQKSTEIPEPEVKIIHKKDSIIEEYRINGQIRYIKIIPSKGPAYYMVDTDGDGEVDRRFNDLENPPINQWILFQW